MATTVKDIATQIGADLEDLEEHGFDVTEPKVESTDDGDGDDTPHEVYIEINGEAFSIVIKKP